MQPPRGVVRVAAAAHAAVHVVLGVRNWERQAMRAVILPGNGCDDIHSANWYGWLEERLKKDAKVFFQQSRIKRTVTYELNHAASLMGTYSERM